jgi:hypothetical protein
MKMGGCVYVCVEGGGVIRCLFVCLFANLSPLWGFKA